MITNLSRIQGALLGVQIGDALGAPVETMKPDEIREALGEKGVTTFLPSIQKRIRETGNMVAGDTTDDWQLTRAVARSIIRSRGWDIKSCIDEHMESYRTSQTGWGKGTRNALRDIHEGKRTGLEPVPYVKGEGGGNGVMMKVMPLAIVSAFTKPYDEETLRSRVKQLSVLTHGDPYAYLGALVIAKFAEVLLKRNYSFFDIAMCSVIEFVGKEEDAIGQFDRPLASSLLKAISLETQKMSMDELVTVFNPGFRAIETAPFVIATFLRNPTDFRTAILEAVNAGGDADTNASIVGGLVGCVVGLEGIPDEWKNFRKEFEEPITIGKELASLVNIKE